MQQANQEPIEDRKSKGSISTLRNKKKPFSPWLGNRQHSTKFALHANDCLLLEKSSNLFGKESSTEGLTGCIQSELLIPRMVCLLCRSSAADGN